MAGAATNRMNAGVVGRSKTVRLLSALLRSQSAKMYGLRHSETF